MQHTHLNERQVLVGEDDVDAALGDEGYVLIPHGLMCVTIQCLSLEREVDRDATGHHGRAAQAYAPTFWKGNCNLVQVRVFDDCRRLASESTPRWS